MVFGIFSFVAPSEYPSSDGPYSSFVVGAELMTTSVRDPTRLPLLPVVLAGDPVSFPFLFFSSVKEKIQGSKKSSPRSSRFNSTLAETVGTFPPP